MTRAIFPYKNLDVKPKFNQLRQEMQMLLDVMLDINYIVERDYNIKKVWIFRDVFGLIFNQILKPIEDKKRWRHINTIVHHLKKLEQYGFLESKRIYDLSGNDTIFITRDLSVLRDDADLYKDMYDIMTPTELYDYYTNAKYNNRIKVFRLSEYGRNELIQSVINGRLAPKDYTTD